MVIEGSAFNGLQWHRSVADNLDFQVVTFQERAQTPSCEKVFVIRLKQMPRNRQMWLKARNHFDIGHRDQQISCYSADLSEKLLRLFDVLQDFDTDSGIKAGVRKR